MGKTAMAVSLVGMVMLPGTRASFAQAGQYPEQQMPYPQNPQTPSNPQNREDERNNDPFLRKQQERMIQARNTQRQQQLVKDTDKLLALATELKAEVDKSSKNTLSVQVVKKAEEIEKLAKSVKDKMRQ